MIMFLIVLLLLSSSTTSSPAVPFYCRRFKGDCSVRRESICCRKENISTAEKEVETVKEQLEEESEDNLVASPSIIEEVTVVSPHETHVQNDFIVALTTPKPGRPVPRFCNLLKFDCKKRSNPICCRDVVDIVIQEETLQEKEKIIESDTVAESISEVGSNNGQDDNDTKTEKAKLNKNYVEKFSRKKIIQTKQA